MFGEQRGDRGFVGGLDVGEDEILRRREAHFRLILFDDGTERGFLAAAVRVLDAPGLDVEAEEERAIERLAPAERVALPRETERLCHTTRPEPGAFMAVGTVSWQIMRRPSW